MRRELGSRVEAQRGGDALTRTVRAFDMMTTAGTQMRQESSTPSKVPEITLAFWIVKIAATTLGETGGVSVTMTLNLGYLACTLILLAVLIAMVIAQTRARMFHPVLYWATIIASTTFGTTMADFADRSLGIGNTGGSALLLACLLLILAGWYASEGTIWVRTVSAPHVEAFYWAAITFSQTLGTALGDWIADTGGLGYEGGALVFGAGLAVLAILYFSTNLSRVFLFWTAFILTRPLGATVGDFLDKPVNDGGLALSRPLASAAIAVFIVLCLALLPQRPARAPHAINIWRRSQQRRQLGELALGEIRDRPVSHTAACPRDHVEPARRADGGRLLGRGRPGEHADLVLLAAIDENRNALPADIIEPSTDEAEPLAAQVLHHRREVQPAGKPGLHRMSVERGDLHGRLLQQAAHMGGDHVARDQVDLAARAHPPERCRGRDPARHHQHCGSTQIGAHARESARQPRRCGDMRVGGAGSLACDARTHPVQQSRRQRQARTEQAPLQHLQPLELARAGSTMAQMLHSGGVLLPGELAIQQGAELRIHLFTRHASSPSC